MTRQQLQQLIKQQRATAFEQGTRRPDFWRSTAELNRYIADLLYERYLKAHEKYRKWMEAAATPPFNWRKVSSKTLSDMGLGRYALMFYGLAMECYLKAYIVKQGFDPIQNASTSNPSLKSQFLNHNLSSYMRQALIPSSVSRPTRYIRNLERAILAGKYPFEKNVVEANAYTAELDETVKFAKSVNRYLKRKLK
jgi:hypothetical protein